MSTNIDFTTFAGYAQSPVIYSGTENNVGSTAVEVQSYTIPDNGLYEIWLSANNYTGSSKGRVYIECLKNTVALLGRGAWSITNYAGNNLAECNTSETFRLQKGDILSITVRSLNITSDIEWEFRLTKIY